MAEDDTIEANVQAPDSDEDVPANMSASEEEPDDSDASESNSDEESEDSDEEDAVDDFLSSMENALYLLEQMGFCIVVCYKGKEVYSTNERADMNDVSYPVREY